MSLDPILENKTNASALHQVLKQAEQALKEQGINAACHYLQNIPLKISDTQSVLTDADKMALLGQFILARDPKSAGALAQYAIDLDSACVEAWKINGYAQELLGFPKEAELAFKQVLQSKNATPNQVLQVDYFCPSLRKGKN